MLRSFFAVLFATSSVVAAPPSFSNEVAPILARAGCNSGPCHGNLNGKGGFKLSLRGEDADFDYLKLTRDLGARRTDATNPDESLMLLKATGKVPHEGGMRFADTSPEYARIRAWIAAGCNNDVATAGALVSLKVNPSAAVLVEPADKTTLTVTATYADGASRNVTGLAAFDFNTIGMANISPTGVVTKERNGETLIVVRYKHLSVPVRVAFIPNRAIPAMPVAKHPIDAAVYGQLKQLRLKPSEICTDEVFIRRAFLDSIGELPTATEARNFLADQSADKRTKLIDELLSRPEFAEFWAQKWSDLLRNEEKSLDKKGTMAFYRWMKAWFAADRPLTDFAALVLAGRGSTYANPASNFYRAIRDPYTRAESVAQVFLGVRVSCARCHNHPFDVWTQDDYHRFSALFAGVDYRVVDNERKDALDKHEFVGDQVVLHKRNQTLPHPRGGDAKPKLLGSSSDVTGDTLDAVAVWVADPSNPFFARAQANRVWHHLLGKGLVDPNDDFRVTNPPTQPQVMDLLAKEFARGGYRLKPLVKFIMTSDTYQRSAVANDTNADDETYFSKALIQPLEAEQLLDALARSLNASVKFTGYPDGTRATQVAAPTQTGKRFGKSGMSERFMKVFGKPDRLLTCECERSDDTGMMQSFQLITGELLHGMLKEPENRIGKLLTRGASPTEMLEDLYLATLARHPNATETKALTDYVTKAKDPRLAWEDVAWGLVNSKEFLLRR